jgi:hypothetical protein
MEHVPVGKHSIGQTASAHRHSERTSFGVSGFCCRSNSWQLICSARKARDLISLPAASLETFDSRADDPPFLSAVSPSGTAGFAKLREDEMNCWRHARQYQISKTNKTATVIRCSGRFTVCETMDDAWKLRQRILSRSRDFNDAERPGMTSAVAGRRYAHQEILGWWPACADSTAHIPTSAAWSGRARGPGMIGHKPGTQAGSGAVICTAPAALQQVSSLALQPAQVLPFC